MPRPVRSPPFVQPRLTLSSSLTSDLTKYVSIFCFLFVLSSTYFLLRENHTKSQKMSETKEIINWIDPSYSSRLFRRDKKILGRRNNGNLWKTTWKLFYGPGIVLINKGPLKRRKTSSDRLVSSIFVHLIISF